MTWLRVIAPGVLLLSITQVTFGDAPWSRYAAALTGFLSVAVFAACFAYQAGRQSGFADAQKFSRAFTRAKEP